MILAFKKIKKVYAWENIQLLALALTIIGQITVGQWFLLGQGLWWISNVIALARDFALRRPIADKIKNAALLGITSGLILLNLFGGMF